MARYTGPVCRMCRREGTKLFLKGERCLTDKCPVTRRGTAPGQHGAAQVKKGKEYYMQLREKQKAKRYYGVLEKQFRSYYEMAAKKKVRQVKIFFASLKDVLTTLFTEWDLLRAARKQGSSFFIHTSQSTERKRTFLLSS